MHKFDVGYLLSHSLGLPFKDTKFWKFFKACCFYVGCYFLFVMLVDRIIIVMIGSISGKISQFDLMQFDYKICIEFSLRVLFWSSTVKRVALLDFLKALDKIVVLAYWNLTRTYYFLTITYLVRWKSPKENCFASHIWITISKKFQKNLISYAKIYFYLLYSVTICNFVCTLCEWWGGWWRLHRLCMIYFLPTHFVNVVLLSFVVVVDDVFRVIKTA